jgi:hypothetical protein
MATGESVEYTGDFKQLKQIKMKENFSSPGFLWPLLALICFVTMSIGLAKVLNKTEWTRQGRLKIILGTTITVAAWIAIVTVLSYRGFFSDFSKLPPRPALALLTPLPFVLAFSFSKTGIKLLQNVPAQWLVFMQSFRIFVEVLIWFAFLANKLPVQMSFEGRNFDALTGMLAIPAGVLLVLKKEWSRAIILAFNILGLALLINIVVIGLLSMPTPIRYFMNEPSNTLLAQFPLILLPTFMVPMAYSLHVFSLRQLFIRQKTGGASNGKIAKGADVVIRDTSVFLLTEKLK